MRLTRRDALTGLMNAVNASGIHGAHLGGRSHRSPSLILPMPPGFAGWVDYTDGQYTAYVSVHTTAPQTWFQAIGSSADSPFLLVARLHTFNQEVIASFTPQPPPFVQWGPPTGEPLLHPQPGDPVPQPPTSAPYSEQSPGPFALDKVNYPTVPTLSLFESVADFLVGMFHPESQPHAAQGTYGPYLCLNTHSHEQVVVFGAYNTLLAAVAHVDDHGTSQAESGPFLVPSEFVHDPGAAALIIGAVFIDALTRARDGGHISLQLRSAIDDEIRTARRSGGALLTAMQEHCTKPGVSPVQLRGLNSVQALSRDYYDLTRT